MPLILHQKLAKSQTAVSICEFCKFVCAGMTLYENTGFGGLGQFMPFDATILVHCCLPSCVCLWCLCLFLPPIRSSLMPLPQQHAPAAAAAAPVSVPALDHDVAPDPDPAPSPCLALAPAPTFAPAPAPGLLLTTRTPSHFVDLLHSRNDKLIRNDGSKLYLQRLMKMRKHISVTLSALSRLARLNLRMAARVVRDSWRLPPLDLGERYGGF